MALGPTIVARFLADTRSLTGALDQAESQGSSKLASLGKAAGAMAGAFAVAGAIDFAGKAISQASDLQESISKVGVVFKTSGDEIIKWSENAADAMGLSQQKALEAVGTFGNLAVSLGLPQEASADMSKNLVGLAADLGSFNNVPVEDALLALRSGLTGETEPLKKFGVNLNDATLKAKALQLGLVESSVDMGRLSQAQENSEKASRKAAEALKAHGENSVEFRDAARDSEQAQAKLAEVMEGKVPASLTAAQKAQASYALIMEQTGVAQGDYARTADGLANSTKSAGAKFEDLQAKVGTALLPAMTALVGFISDTVIPGIEKLGAAIGESEGFKSFVSFISGTLLPALQSIGEFIGTTIVPAIVRFFDLIVSNKDVVLAVFTAIGIMLAATILPAMIALIPTAVGLFAIWVAGAVSAGIATLVAAAPFILIGAAIAALAFLIIRNWDTISAVVSAVFGAIVGVVQGVISWITEHWQTILAIITGPIGLAVMLVTQNWDTIKAAVASVIAWVAENWPTLLAIITGPIGIAVLLITKNWDTIKDGATAVWQWVVAKWEQLQSGIQKAIDLVRGYIDLLVNVYFRWPMTAATALFDFVSGKFRELADFIFGIVGRIKDAATSIADAIKAPINAILRTWNTLGLNVPTITIPEVNIPFVGKVGGGTFGGQRFDFPDVPLLAGGGVLTRPTLFVGGESGTEIVAPETLLRSIVAEGSGGGHYTLNIYPRTADSADVAYGFRRLELLAGL